MWINKEVVRKKQMGSSLAIVDSCLDSFGVRPLSLAFTPLSTATPVRRHGVLIFLDMLLALRYILEEKAALHGLPA